MQDNAYATRGASEGAQTELVLFKSAIEQPVYFQYARLTLQHFEVSLKENNGVFRWQAFLARIHYI